MSSSTRILKSTKPRNRQRNGRTKEIELDIGIKSALCRIKQLEVSFKLHYLRFQISKMADNDQSISLMEPATQPMSQVEDEDGSLAFKCNSCPPGKAVYKQLKRLQTHLLSKHGISIDLDETVTNFSPSMVSTHEDAVSAAEPGDQAKGEPTKTPKKRPHESDEEEDEEDSNEEIARYRREKEKRARYIDDLAREFVNDISDGTMEEALEAAEQGSPSETQAMTEQISQKIREAEKEVEVLEGHDDSAEKDEQAIMSSLQRRLELKDNLLNVKDSRIIDLEDKITSLQKKLDEKEHVLKNKKLLVKEKDKEIKDITKKAKLITKAAGKSPSKEELKDKCLKHARQVENLRGRLKNLDANRQDTTVQAKLEQTIATQIKEIDMIKETLSRFEAKEIQLMKKIPCEQRPCPHGRKQCKYNHDLEYKKPTDHRAKILCKYFAGTGCELHDDCPYSHSIEMAVKADQSRAATGGNQQAIGSRRDSYLDSYSESNTSRGSLRQVTEGANNNMSVELVADLRHVPANDARRTIIQKRTPKKENAANSTYHRAGNDQGSSTWRPRQEDPRHRSRSHRSTSTSGRNQSSWDRSEGRRGQYERDPRDNGFRSGRERRRF